MNCTLVNNAIEALDINNFSSITSNTHEVLNSKLDASMITHINTCSTCTKTLQEHTQYLYAMSSVKTPEYSELEANTLLSKVVNSSATPAIIATHKKASNDTGFLQGFIAASVLAVSIFGAWNIYNTQPIQQPSLVDVSPEYFTTEVVLVINAPEDMYDADLNIILPQQIALEGYDNIQDLSWPVDLKAGTNTLSLPIRVNKNKSIEQPLSIMAKLYHYAEEREFEIKVDVESMKSQQKNSAYLATSTNKISA